MKSKLVIESLNEFQDTPEYYLYVFVDEDDFDYYDEDMPDGPHSGNFVGYSELFVYASTEEIDVYDNGEVYDINKRDSLPQVGTVLVGFDEDGAPEALEVIDGDIDLEKVEFLWPM